jgi:hypothetical protein
MYARGITRRDDFGEKIIGLEEPIEVMPSVITTIENEAIKRYGDDYDSIEKFVNDIKDGLERMLAKKCVSC